MSVTFGKLSFRIRVPLTLVATSGLTAAVIGAVIVVHTYTNLRQDLTSGAQQLGSAMVPALTLALKHDDVWQAYTVLRGPRQNDADKRSELIVLDERLHVFAANRPRRYHTGAALADADSEIAQLSTDLQDGLPTDFRVYNDRFTDRLVTATPVLADGTAIGVLIISYPRSIFWARFWDIAGRGFLSMLAVMAVIAAVGWYWGGRMVRPLTHLSRCMARVGHEPLDQIQFQLSNRNDEIGRLQEHFRQMLDDLRTKAALEREVVVAERLAALGRLAAGVAHEINNPLAGMLVAVDNLKRRGGLEAQTERTIGLIERGLQHIRETVAALLVEARMEARDLKPQDIEDVHTLARTQCEKANVRLIWRNRLDHALELPSTPIRQVLLNLLLNAADAAAPGGKVMCELLVADGRLNIILENDGAPIPPEQAQHLFEPFYSTRPDGTGLGLWITYQIVQQLHGDIQLASNHRLSRFHIQIPLQPPPGERSVA